MHLSGKWCYLRSRQYACSFNYTDSSWLARQKPWGKWEERTALELFKFLKPWTSNDLCVWENSCTCAQPLWFVDMNHMQDHSLNKQHCKGRIRWLGKMEGCSLLKGQHIKEIDNRNYSPVSTFSFQWTNTILTSWGPKLDKRLISL